MTNAQYLKLLCNKILSYLQKQAQKKEKHLCNCQMSELEQLKIQAMDRENRRIEPLKTWENSYVAEDHMLYFEIDGDKSCHSIIMAEE